MSVCWLGVDPGITGGAVLLSPAGAVLAEYRMPVIAGALGAKAIHDSGGVRDLLEGARDLARASSGGELRLAIEDVHGGPKMAGSSGFSFGFGVGLWHGVASVLRVPLVRVKPQEWQRVVLRGKASGGAKIKQVSFLTAREMFPALALRSLSADSGRADAALIAEAVRRLSDARAARVESRSGAPSADANEAPDRESRS